MVQIDVPAAFAVGMLSIDLGRDALRSEAERAGGGKALLYYRYLARTLFFAGFVVAPAGIYLLSGWPGWEQMYWSRRVEQVMHTGWVNALLPALFVMAIMLAAYLGHTLGYRLLVGGNAACLRPIYIGALLLTGAVALFNYPAFILVGTYDQYHGQHGQTREAMLEAWRNPYGFSVGWVGVMLYFVVALAIFVVAAKKPPRSETSARQGGRAQLP